MQLATGFLCVLIIFQRAYPRCKKNTRSCKNGTSRRIITPCRAIFGRDRQNYKSTLDHLMAFICHREFARDYIYSDEELHIIQPHHVLQWMNVKTFGIANPGIDANPISARSNSLTYWKKAISFSPRQVNGMEFWLKRGKPNSIY